MFDDLPYIGRNRQAEINKTFESEARLKNIQKKINFIIHCCKSCHEKLHVLYSSNINIYDDV